MNQVSSQDRSRKRPFYVLPAIGAAVLVGIGALVGCGNDKPDVVLAPTATALQSAKPPATVGALKFTVDKASSKVDFMMEAPQEKIHGRANGSSEGTLNIDPSDITKTTGLVTCDIAGLELLQNKADDSGKFGTESKNDLQNTHARTWLEISDDAPPDVRKANEKVQFSITSIEGASATDVTKMTGDTRKVTFKAKGDFLLHGHKTQKTAELEATFTWAGDKPTSVVIKTTQPLAVGLAENDVKPREAFGKFAQKTLEVLSPKVAKEALVTLELKANAP